MSRDFRIFEPFFYKRRWLCWYAVCIQCVTMQTWCFKKLPRLESSVVFTNKRIDSKIIYCVFQYRQRIDNIYTQVAVHKISNWLTSGESIPLLLSSVPYLPRGPRILSQSSTMIHRCWANLLPLSHCLRAGLPLSLPSLDSWTFSFSDSFDEVCRDGLTLLEPEYCPTSLPTVSRKGSV